jgi:hypothetical protein
MLILIGVVVVALVAGAVILLASRPAREIAYKLGYAAGYQDARHDLLDGERPISELAVEVGARLARGGVR